MSRFAPVEDLPRLVRWKIARWQGNPEYDDMLAEAYLASWRCYRACGKVGAAVNQAAWGPINWLRKWHGRTNDAVLRQTAEYVPLDAVADLPAPSTEREALDAIVLNAALSRLVSDRQREVLVRFFIEEQTLTEIAADFGCTQQSVSLVKQRALARLRAWYGERG